MNHIPEQKEELIIKFLQHEASEHEIEMLKAWLEEDASHKKYFDEVNDAFQASVTMARFNHERIDNAWHNVYQKINLQGSIEKRVHSGNAFTFLKIAAAISAVIMLSYLAWHRYSLTKANPDHAIVHNSERQNTRVDLPDGTIVWLNTNSTLEYPSDFNATSREVLLKGEAFFDVRKDNNKSFVVKTKDVSVYVKGTRFNVRAYIDENDVKTTLEEGKVEIQVKGSKDVYTLEPGDQITFNANLKKVTRHTVDPSDYTSWKEDKLVFDDTPLGEIILKLENRYKVNITVDSAIAKRERLTMTIEQETIDDVLEFIRLSSHLKYRKDKNQIFIYE